MPAAEPAPDPAEIDVERLKLALTVYMSANGIKPYRVAQRAGVRAAALTELYRHGTRPSGGTVLRLCGLMHLDPALLLLPPAQAMPAQENQAEADAA